MVLAAPPRRGRRPQAALGTFVFTLAAVIAPVGVNGAAAARALAPSGTPASWEPGRLPRSHPQVSMLAASCARTGGCVAVGKDQGSDIDVWTSANWGRDWSAHLAVVAGHAATPRPDLLWAATSCPGPSSCYVFGFWQADFQKDSSQRLTLWSSGPKGTWAAHPGPPGQMSGFPAYLLTGFSCPRPNLCYMSAQGPSGFGLWSWAPERAWTALPLPAGYTVKTTGYPPGGNLLSCPAAGVCRLAGNPGPTPTDAAVWFSSDSGHNWAARHMTKAPLSSVNNLDCPTLSFCALSGNKSGFETPTSGSSGAPAFFSSTTNGGRSWRTQPLASSTIDLLFASCPTSAACYGIGVTGSTKVGGPERQVLMASSTLGARWRTERLPAGADGSGSQLGMGTSGVDDLRCANASRCVIAANSLTVVAPCGPGRGCNRGWRHMSERSEHEPAV